VTLFDDRVAAMPLAARMRPTSVADVVGQETILQPGTPLGALLHGDRTAAVSVILYGPPGSGKTTLATLISRESGRQLVELSAVTAGIRDVRAVIEHARQERAMHDRGTVVFIDEVHRFSKTQQDALLPAVENGWITLVAATTENPSFSVISPLLSRSIVVPLQPLTDRDIGELIDRAVASELGLNGTVSLSSAARDALIAVAAGDARRALTALEAAAAGKSGELDIDDIERAVAVIVLRYDKNGDQHYDVISAFIKSIRGSDPDAALHYLARMLAAGEDPRFIARRIMIVASEDIGLADNSVLQTATAAAQAVAMVGMPEARIILAHAVIHASLAPKSNSVVAAISRAEADVGKGGVGTVPPHLRDAHYPGAKDLGHGVAYAYPHDCASGVAAQQYLPDPLVGRRYYTPSVHGQEQQWATVVERLTKLRESDER
jgi:putative ATPase